MDEPRSARSLAAKMRRWPETSSSPFGPVRTMIGCNWPYCSRLVASSSNELLGELSPGTGANVDLVNFAYHGAPRKKGARSPLCGSRVL